MDPDATLRTVRAIVGYYRGNGVTDDAAGNLLEELITYVDSLDSWLSEGGFLPTDWNAKRKG